jgi:hypothetical protein
MHVEGLTPVEIHHHLVEVYKAQVILWKQMWMWCSSFDNDRTNVDKKQVLGCPSVSTMDDSMCRANALIEVARHIKLTDITQKPWIVHAALSTKLICDFLLGT